VYYAVVALFDGVAGTAEGEYGFMATRHLNLPTE
jgi:hypothetical protein